MKRGRQNRRKSPRRELPKLPAVRLPAINWAGLSMLAASVGVLGFAFALGRDLLDVPIRHLEIQGSFQRVTKFEIEAAALPSLDSSLLTIDLDATRARIADIDWVDRVEIRREWPDSLHIAFTEHQAAARWGDQGLLNTHGELFADDVDHQYRELPQLDGPEGSHRRVIERYLQLRDQVAGSPLALASIVMDARGAFQAEMTNGLSIRFGRQDVADRIDRFFAVTVRALQGELEQADYIDMRYPSGFAVGWRENSPLETQLARLDTSG